MTLEQINEILYQGACSISGYDIAKKSRKTNIVHSRAAFFVVGREQGVTFEMLGSKVGKDHATVINAVKKADKHYSDNAYFNSMVAQLRTLFLEKSPDPDEFVQSLVREKDMLEERVFRIKCLINSYKTNKIETYN